MAHAPHRILIVEDNILLADAIAGLVRQIGYEVIGPFHNLNDAVCHATRDDMHFALLDFDLGKGTDSTPVAEALIARGVPFAFTTGTAASIIRKVFEHALILSKPVGLTELARVLPA